MKRTLLATAIGLTFIGATAQLCLAQPYGRDGGDSAQYGQSAGQAAPAGAEDGWGRHWRRDRRGYADDEANEAAGPGPRPEGPMGPPGVPHRPPPPPSPGNAAHFVFQRGHARIDITCPQFFPLRDCIEAATELLDKIHSLRGEAHRPGTSGLPMPQTSPPGGIGLAPGTFSPGTANLPTPQATPPGSGAGLTPRSPSPGPGAGPTPQAPSPGAANGLTPHVTAPGPAGEHRM